MSGGVWQYVMTKLTNSVGSSGFTKFPERKYYDLFDKSIVKKMCKDTDYGQTCWMELTNPGKYDKGFAISETGKWYSDFDSIINNSWFIYGGYFYYSSNTNGIFAHCGDNGSGKGGTENTFRMVISPEN